MVASSGQSFLLKNHPSTELPEISSLVGLQEKPAVFAVVAATPQLVPAEDAGYEQMICPARHLRTATGPSVSQVDRWLAKGKEIVPAEGNLSGWYQSVKRTLDVVGAFGLLVLFSPLMAGTWLVLFVTTRGKPIFRQVRLGYRGRPFTVYKFQTMVPDAALIQHQVKNEKDGPIFKNRHDSRITPIGRFLRSTSIDEMPQLFNVLAGQMSLVGPRPPICKEVTQYEPWQRRRLAVKPGLTCLWQVSGRSEIAFEQWVRMDLWYTRHQSLLVDLGLLLRTPWSVLSRHGAY